MSFPASLELLTDWLRDRDREYYVEDNPTVEDSVYDAAVQAYKKLAGKSWEVLGAPSEKLTRVPHVTPMLSLYKVTEILGADGLVVWTPHSEEVYVLLPKIDGMAGRIKYTDGKLVGAVSRGDGSVGESILHSLRPILGSFIPVELPDPPPGDFYVGGEVYLPKAFFPLVGGANPRNAGAGLVRRQTPDPKQAYLRFVAYNLIDSTGHAGETYLEQLEWLRCQGFEVPPHITINGEDFPHLEVPGLHPDEWLNPDETLPYEIDGAVLTLNNLAKRAALGETGHHPRWAVAVKFETKTAVAELLAMEWNAGRTGVIPPTAVFTAVNLCGTVVTRATMHNLEHYQKMQARVGDKVIIEKRGDIIPAVKGKVDPAPVTASVPMSLPYPATCPTCSHPTVVSLPHLVCVNPGCKAKLVSLIEHACKRPNLDVNGVGEEVAQAVVDAGLVKNLEDFLKLTEEQLANMPFGKGTFGTVRAKKLVTNLEKTSEKPWNVVLHSLGCPGLGEPEADLIAAKFDLVTMVMMPPVQLKMELMSIKGVGEKTAVAFTEWLRVNQNWLARYTFHSDGQLASLGGIVTVLNTHPEVIDTRKQTLLGYTIVLTGTFSSKAARSDYEKRLKALGCEVPGSVSAKTTYLVAGANVGATKTDAAKKHGVKVIDEATLLDLLKEHEK